MGCGYPSPHRGRAAQCAAGRWQGVAIASAIQAACAVSAAAARAAQTRSQAPASPRSRASSPVAAWRRHIALAERQRQGQAAPRAPGRPNDPRPHISLPAQARRLHKHPHNSRISSRRAAIPYRRRLGSNRKRGQRQNQIRPSRSQRPYRQHQGNLVQPKLHQKHTQARHARHHQGRAESLSWPSFVSVPGLRNH